MAQEPVVLHNRNRFKSFQFTMYHSIVCKEEGRCICGTMPAMGADRRGELVRAEQSVFIPAKGYTRPLPRSVLSIPQVKAALAEQPTFLVIANQLAEIQVYKATPAVAPASVPMRPVEQPIAPPPAPRFSSKRKG